MNKKLYFILATIIFSNSAVGADTKKSVHRKLNFANEPVAKPEVPVILPLAEEQLLSSAQTFAKAKEPVPNRPCPDFEAMRNAQALRTAEQVAKDGILVEVTRGKYKRFWPSFFPPQLNYPKTPRKTTGSSHPQEPPKEVLNGFYVIAENGETWINSVPFSRLPTIPGEDGTSEPVLTKKACAQFTSQRPFSFKPTTVAAFFSNAANPVSIARLNDFSHRGRLLRIFNNGGNLRPFQRKELEQYPQGITLSLPEPEPQDEE